VDKDLQKSSGWRVDQPQNGVDSFLATPSADERREASVPFYLCPDQPFPPFAFFISSDDSMHMAMDEQFQQPMLPYQAHLEDWLAGSHRQDYGRV